jgi:hypothetical protein
MWRISYFLSPMGHISCGPVLEPSSLIPSCFVLSFSCP